MNELTEQQVIDQLADKLVPIYPGVGPDEVSRVVHEKYARYKGGRSATSSLCWWSAALRKS